MNRDREPIVSGPERWSWPWQAPRDLDIGVRPAIAKGATIQGGKPSARARRVERAAQTYSQPRKAAGWRSLPVSLVILAALLFHLLPMVGRFGGGEDALAARAIMSLLGGWIPEILDTDIAGRVVPAAAAWLWQPWLPAIAAIVLRLVALNTASRDAVAAVWIAAVALLIDGATWMFMGLKLWGEAFSPAEGAALIELLKLEGIALFVLLIVVSPRRRKSAEG